MHRQNSNLIGFSMCVYLSFSLSLWCVCVFYVFCRRIFIFIIFFQFQTKIFSVIQKFLLLLLSVSFLSLLAGWFQNQMSILNFFDFEYHWLRNEWIKTSLGKRKFAYETLLSVLGWLEKKSFFKSKKTLNMSKMKLKIRN